MDKIGAYSAYQKTYAESLNSRKESTVSKKEEGKSVNSTEKSPEKVALSDKAKNLLKELQKKYGNMDFIVADYETDEEASALLARGTKEYSVLIEPDVLEQMAEDEKVKQKYLKLIDEATDKLSDLKDELEKSGEQVTRFGISVGEDGKVSFFAELEKISEKQKERIESGKEARKAEREEEKKAEDRKRKEQLENKENAWSGTEMDKSKRLFIQASTPEEMLEKIKSIDWSNIKETETGSNHIDFSV